MPKKRMEVKPKTEGQRLFDEVKGQDSDLAKKIGCGTAIIGHWRRGRRIPAEGYRHKLELLFGIPRRAWDVEAGQKATKATKATKEPKKAATRRTTGSDETLEIAKSQVSSILGALDDDQLTDAAAAKLRDTLSKLLALRARMERDQEMLEDRAVREHPEWLRVKRAIITALKPYPDAASAVAEALK